MTDISGTDSSGAVDRAEWSQILDQLTERHTGELIKIELLDETFGDQDEVERLPFAYASYDPRDDVVIVAVGGDNARYPVVLRHMVWHPTEVSATDEARTGTAIRVADKDGTATLVTFYPRTD